MPTSGTPRPDDEAFWRDFLTRGDPRERRLRRLFVRLPHGPRCRLCAAPFAGVGAPLMRAIGKRPSVMDPATCNTCFDFMAKHHGGAEIEASFMFADIRGSTTLAEQMPPGAFHAVIDRFLATATQIVFEHDGAVDRFIGDEIVAFFFPMMAGDRHAARAVEAATEVLRATGHGEAGGPWVSVGAGVGSGLAWVGAVGDDQRTELTALGDVVNTTARLAAVARAGELLVTVEAATAAGLGPLEPRLVELKGKRSPTAVVSLMVEPAAGAPV